MKKKLCMFAIIMSFNIFLFSNEIKTFEDGKVTFEVPNSQSIAYKGEKHDPAKIKILVNSIKSDDIPNWNYKFSDLLYKQLQSDGLKINKEHIVNLIKNNDVLKTGTFSIGANWYNYYGKIITRNYLPVSYKKLIYEDQYIGESFLCISDINTGFKLVDRYFSISYQINFVMADRIVYIDLWLVWGDFKSLYETFTDWFKPGIDGKYYWIDQQAQYDFFEVFDGNEYIKLSGTFRLLRETRDIILETLKIYDEK